MLRVWTEQGCNETQPNVSMLRLAQETRRRPRVLVVEFRDEVYAGLAGALEDQNCLVGRAERGAVACGELLKFSPDLVLVNGDMPDESGWLVACKMKFTRRRRPVWLYTVHSPQSPSDWKEIAGVSRVIEYGGVLIRLLDRVRSDLRSWSGFA